MKKLLTLSMALLTGPVSYATVAAASLLLLWFPLRKEVSHADVSGGVAAADAGI